MPRRKEELNIILYTSFLMYTIILFTYTQCRRWSKFIALGNLRFFQFNKYYLLIFYYYYYSEIMTSTIRKVRIRITTDNNNNNLIQTMNVNICFLPYVVIVYKLRIIYNVKHRIHIYTHGATKHICSKRKKRSLYE